MTIEAVAATPRHARLCALSADALALYDRLSAIAAPSGYVADDALWAAMRGHVDLVSCAELRWFELATNASDDELGLWIVDPVTLDQADALASGAVP